MAAASEPVFVVYKAAGCKFCIMLDKIWDSVVNALKSVYPKLRFATVICRTTDGVIDPNIYPADIRRYAAWFPMMLMVPGHVWDHAMQNLGPHSSAKLIEGVKMMNGEWVGGKITWKLKYSSDKADGFVRWVKDVLSDPEFQAIQYKSKASEPIKPPTPVSPLSVPSSTLSPLSPPMTPITPAAPMRTSESSHDDAVEDIIPHICSMRIRSRP